MLHHNHSLYYGHIRIILPCALTITSHYKTIKNITQCYGHRMHIFTHMKKIQTSTRLHLHNYQIYLTFLLEGCDILARGWGRGSYDQANMAKHDNHLGSDMGPITMGNPMTSHYHLNFSKKREKREKKKR